MDTTTNQETGSGNAPSVPTVSDLIDYLGQFKSDCEVAHTFKEASALEDAVCVEAFFECWAHSQAETVQ